MDIGAHTSLHDIFGRVNMLPASLAGISEITYEISKVLDIHNSPLQRLQWANRIASMASEVLDMDLTAIRMRRIPIKLGVLMERMCEAFALAQ